MHAFSVGKIVSLNVKISLKDTNWEHLKIPAL